MRILIAFILAIVWSALPAQVQTRFFPDGNALSDTRLSNLAQTRNGKVIQRLPAFDAFALLQEDSVIQAESMGDVPFRFGKDFEVNVSLKDGIWNYIEGGRVWSMSFLSEGAYSLNFIFENFYLPEGGELYIANQEETILYGPVTSNENPENGCFFTDLIEGDHVSIYLYEPENKAGQSTLSVKKAVHAYRDAYSMRSASLGCHNNVDCYSAYSNEARAVALVLLADGTAWCSGSLVMTTDQSFKPYFLTAFHCVDINPANGSLSQDEKNSVNNWMFKFDYIQPCSTGKTFYATTYNGSSFKAGTSSSDFLLLELKNVPTRATWLGWDRRNTNATSGTMIHHPQGDYMKISFANSSIPLNSTPLSWRNGPESPALSHWNIIFSNGAVEPGSSGAPLINQDKRLIGQLHGGIDGCPPQKAYSGAFHYSWNNNTSSNETQLKPWLDPINRGLETTNTSSYPRITGGKIVCGTSTYSLQNVSYGSVTWRVSGDLAIVSGQGSTQLQVQKAYVNGSGKGTITAVTNNGVSVSLDVYAPSPTVQSINGPKNPGLNNEYVYSAIPFITDITENIDYEWSVHPPGNAPLVKNPEKRTCTIRFLRAGSYEIWCSSKTNCGVQPGGDAILYVTAGDLRYTMFQRDKLLTLSTSDQSNSPVPVVYNIYEVTTGKVKITGSFKESTTVDLNSLQAGAYLVRIGEDYSRKIMVQ